MYWNNFGISSIKQREPVKNIDLEVIINSQDDAAGFDGDIRMIREEE